MIIAAHSDDETLGCGGTIAALTAEGWNVHAVFLTDGVGARATSPNNNSYDQRRSAAHAAAKTLGIRSVTQLDFPDNQLDTVPILEVIQALEPVIADLEPQTIYTHIAEDLNIDHRICHQAVLTACRPQPGQSVCSIYGFEIPSSTEWAFSASGIHPNFFVDISKHLQIKLAALKNYETELRAFPHPRSIEGVTALAKWRGATVGLEAAEAFSVIRQIQRIS